MAIIKEETTIYCKSVDLTVCAHFTQTKCQQRAIPAKVTKNSLSVQNDNLKHATLL